MIAAPLLVVHGVGLYGPKDVVLVRVLGPLSVRLIEANGAP